MFSVASLSAFGGCRAISNSSHAARMSANPVGGRAARHADSCVYACRASKKRKIGVPPPDSLMVSLKTIARASEHDRSRHSVIERGDRRSGQRDRARHRRSVEAHGVAGRIARRNEETAASMEELASTVAKNADNAAEGTHAATKACGDATQGGDTVNNVVATMRSIAQASSHMADIIGVIEGIAFQTNILALNAAVEAGAITADTSRTGLTVRAAASSRCSGAQSVRRRSVCSGAVDGRSMRERASARYASDAPAMASAVGIRKS